MHIVQCRELQGGESEQQHDFGSLCIKEEPGWSLDTAGYTEPQDQLVLEFTKPQIKVEIVSDSEEDSSSSSSSDEEDVKEEAAKEEKPEVEKEEGPPRTKNELGMSDLPAVEDLELRVQRAECQAVGVVASTVDQLLVIESLPDMPALDLDSVLFAVAADCPDSGPEQLAAIGRVFDVLGPVTRPFYCVRFNSEEHAKSKQLTNGQTIYFAPKTEHTSFVFLEQLMKMKISDASWCNDEELPPDFQDFSDDEQETRARQTKKLTKMTERGAEPAQVTAKRARMEQGRARQEQRPGQQDPRVNNGLYAQHVNPFYRQQRSYDPRALGGGGIHWGNYGPAAAPAYSPAPQYAPPPHPVHQYHHQAAYSPYSVPPPPLPSGPGRAALQGGAWGAHYQAAPLPAWGPPPPPPPPE
jgi:H/ACA ribonucleoprotein complex non-core subunit NAF1